MSLTITIDGIVISGPKAVREVEKLLSAAKQRLDSNLEIIKKTSEENTHIVASMEIYESKLDIYRKNT